MTTTPVPSHLTAEEDTSDTPTKRSQISQQAAASGYVSPSDYMHDYNVNSATHGQHDPISSAAVVSSSSTPTPSNDIYGYTFDQSTLHQRHQPQQLQQLQAEYHAEYVPLQEQTTPPIPEEEEDRTPVVTDIHAQPIALPGHPNITNSNAQPTPLHTKQPLLSPFKAFGGQQQTQQQQPQPHEVPMGYPLPIEHQQYLDNTALYYGQTGFVPYPANTAMGFNPYPAQYMATQPQGLFTTDMYQPQPQYNFAGPPRSRNGSPTSSIASSSVPSLTRAGSTSTRPKVKLTYEDKRNIVELHRQNSSLRQEDIARMYGVDRSTISKIILSSHRWTQPQEPQAPIVPKLPKAVGGRFPAVEAKLDEWMDAQIASGQDVRDSIARDKAKTFAREIGFPMDRFKASAKWLDKFKDRRKAAGKAVASPTQPEYGYYAYPGGAYPVIPSPLEGGVLLSRSQSTATLSSSDSSGQDQYTGPVYMSADGGHSRMGSTRSESDLLGTVIDANPGSRSRSQSSPQVLAEPGTQTPSSGKALKQRPTPLALQRQNSFHGTSPSPRRPGGLSRTNSIQGSTRRQNRPLSLAASAFGFTTVDPTQSPMTSPTTSHHSRQRSDASVANGFSGMTISPNMSENGESTGMMPMSMSVGTIPPLTPITPGQASAGNHIFPSTDYGDLQTEMPVQGQIHVHAQAHVHAPTQAAVNGHVMVPMQVHGQYATMPSKLHGQHMQYAQQGVAYPVADFGPAPGYVMQAAQQGAWR
ncbi:hypothetical protein IAU60_004021 [Kwoniella sp. DSM 27419]